ncbi:hypothetical protein Rsub_00729 [Raphidocelis subcapitata]|uniref:Cytochrome P450 n=1 Tax=Raphidocelis subcapitata TaxID=307507 RepID=A0A2V0NSW5_9CHLO|nr:hypothetical protein Rsub_00729 [Raphidocelis subcapitata]|eukprot:GBF88017.1 hypothetical protein Rsub_00729 [Raphidocelis subcapitata]
MQASRPAHGSRGADRGPAAARPAAAARRPRRRRAAGPVAALQEPSPQPAPAPPALNLPDGRQPWWNVLKQLSRPAAYFSDVLKGRDAAVGQFGVFHDTAFIGSPALARELLGSEERSGINVGWGPALVQLVGERSVSMVADPEEHARQRALLMPFFSPDVVAAKMPAIQATARRYLAEWVSSPAPFSAYDGMKRFTFDVLVNQVLELSLDDAEVTEMSRTFQAWARGFLPPAVDVPFTPFGQGMAARNKIRDKILSLLAAGRLPPDGLVARLQSHFGGDTEAIIDNIINVQFAGHDTSSSSLTSMLGALAANPRVLARLADEQAAVVAAHGEALTPAAVAAAPYAAAVVRETLRMRLIVPGVMRKAEKDVQLAGGLSIPKGCPVLVAFSAIADREPAWEADRGEFRPERFLTGGSGGSGGPEALAPQPAGFNPFGIGTRYCLGSHLALAEMGAMVAELGRLAGSHALEVEQPGRWEEFPILRPDNGLPTRFVAKPPGAAGRAPERELLSAQA